MAGFFNNIFGQQKEVGPQDQAKRFYQNPLLNNMQQGAQALYQAKALKDMLFPSGSSFEPIRNEALRQYRENTLPNIMNQVGQRPGSSAYGQMVGRSQEDLETRLAGLRADWQDRQNERTAQNARQMMQYGMQPSFETVYAPVPTESTKAYLQQQGLPVTPENIAKYQGQFEPQQMLGQNITQGIQNLPQTIKTLPQNIQDYIKSLSQATQQARTGEVPLSRPVQGGAQTVSQMLAQTPQVQASVNRSLEGATAEQKSASNYVLSNKKHMMPLLDSNLQPGDWPFIEAVMKSPSPELQSMIYRIEDRDQLQRLYKLLDIKDEKKRLAQVKKFMHKLGTEAQMKSKRKSNG